MSRFSIDSGPHTHRTLSVLVDPFAGDVTLNAGSIGQITAQPTADSTVLGINGAQEGQEFSIVNDSAFLITLSHENAGAAEEARLFCAYGVDKVIPPKGTATLIYSDSLARWVVTSPSDSFSALASSSHVLSAAVSIGATSTSLAAFPNALDVLGWIVIDAFTTEAELRPITSVSGGVVNFATPLVYAHVRSDVALIVFDSTVNVKWFGAAGGGADETVRIQRAALAAAGGALLFPAAASFYGVADVITVPANTRVVGVGFGSAVKLTATEKNAFALGDNCEVSGMNIGGPAAGGASTAYSTGNGIWVNGAKNITIKNNYIHGFNGSGICVTESSNLNVTDNWLYQNTGGGSNTDVLFYGGATGSARSTINNNFCLSNNSQGICVNINGPDSDISIVGNVCVSLNSSWAEVAAGSLVRRHGILASYNGVDYSGRTAIVGNVIRNTLWTGIDRVNALGGSPTATVISGNTISLVGLEANNYISGGILLNLLGRNDLCEGNTIYDYRGTLGYNVGAITCNGSALVGAFATIRGNAISLSTGHGVAVIGQATNVVVDDNRIEGVTGNDIYCLANASTATAGDCVITRNKINHNINTTAAAIYYNIQDGTVKSLITDNVIKGYDATTNVTTNTGIYIVGAAGPVSIKRNAITNAYFGVFFNSYLAGRLFNTHQIDYNEFETVHMGVVVTATSTAAVVPLEGNVFRNVTTNTDGNGGYIVGYIATREGTTLRVHDQFTAAPTVGTWAVGDYATQKTPGAGQPKGWVCTAAGNPGTWTVDAPSGTTGSVPFFGSSGQLTEDNANIFWDDPNNRFGINTAASPATSLHIAGGAATLENSGNNALADAVMFGTAGYPTTYLNKIRSSVAGGAGLNQLAFIICDGTSGGSVPAMALDRYGVGALHLLGNSTAPTVAITAAGAGANATTSVAGTDLSGTITLNTNVADTPAANSDILTLTFNTTYGAAPRVVIMPANDAAWALAYAIVRLRQADVTTTTFKLRSGATPLPAVTAATYTYNYVVVQ